MSEHELRILDARKIDEARNAEITKSLEAQRATVEAAQAALIEPPPEPCKHNNAIKVEGSKDDARWCVNCGALGLHIDGDNTLTWFPPKG